MSDLRSLPVTTLQGSSTSFGELTGGRPALVVNVASRCGPTPQYTQLEELQQEFGDRGFTVLGVPCNQFMGQEPGNFEKWLISGAGEVVARFRPRTEVRTAIEALLA